MRPAILYVWIAVFVERKSAKTCISCARTRRRGPWPLPRRGRYNERQKHKIRANGVVYEVFAAGGCCDRRAFGQRGQARVEAEASSGRPFGVGQVTISGLDAAIDANRVFVEEKNGRVFYPAVTQGVLGRLIGQILGDATDRPATGVTIYFCSAAMSRWS